MLTRRGFLKTTTIGTLGLEAGLGIGQLTSAAGPSKAQPASSQPRNDNRNRPAVTLNVNGAAATVAAEPETPLLWVLREQLGLKGTKYGCGVGMCGTCTVHLDGELRRSCVTPASEAVATFTGRPITHRSRARWTPAGGRLPGCSGSSAPAWRRHPLRHPQPADRAHRGRSRHPDRTMALEQATSVGEFMDRVNEAVFDQLDGALLLFERE